MITFETIIIAFLLTIFAGLSTAIGSCLAFFCKKTNTKFLSAALGFSAGVMIYVSFVEIFVESQELLMSSYGARLGMSIAIIGFFGGIAISALIDKFIPEFGNPHEIHKVEEMQKRKQRKLYCVGMCSAVAVAVHNFPEGIATFISAIGNLKLGIPIAIAVAIHNIPEGIAISVPIFYSTGSRKKAFYYSAMSGLAEPLGALLAYLVLMPFLNDTLLGVMFAIVAGIMIYISLDQLLPTAEEYGEHHIAIYGLVMGMAVMAVSLLLFI